MAEEVDVAQPGNNNRAQNCTMIELAICQPDHPNQAMFVENLDITLREFRASISENGLRVPDEWVFMTRLGSLLSTDQETDILLSSITRNQEGSDSVDVMLTPYLDQQNNHRPMGANIGNGHLANFATIVAALRDIYVTSIQPNLHEFIKPLAIAAAVVAFFSFVLAAILTLSLASLGGLSRSYLAPLVCRSLCSGGDDAALMLPKMQQRIQELERSISKMRQVEVGILVCEGESRFGEEPERVQLSFRKTNFTETPRIIFGLKDTSIDNFNTFKLKNLHVSPVGFSVDCAYSGGWAQYSMQFSWVAVGK